MRTARSYDAWSSEQACANVAHATADRIYGGNKEKVGRAEPRYRPVWTLDRESAFEGGPVPSAV